MLFQKTFLAALILIWLVVLLFLRILHYSLKVIYCLALNLSSKEVLVGEGN